MSVPATHGRRTIERRRLIGALAASSCLHLVAIAVWISLFSGVFAGVPTPATLRDRLGAPSVQTNEVVFTSIELRVRPSAAPRYTPHRRAVAHLPARLAVVAARADVAARPVPPRVRRVRAAATEPPQAFAVSPPSKAEATVEPPASAAPASLPAAQPSAPPTPAPKAAEAGLWGLDSAPVLLDGAAGLIGEVHRQLRIEIAVDAHGRATDVHVDDPGADRALVEHIVNALLTARYAAARCNNLPCSGQLVFAYP
ncbi:hypothetical protein EPN44_02690 [bacterium]|nr:MAG: hypothetical protein EPN44_02690 [bacterium]